MFPILRFWSTIAYIRIALHYSIFLMMSDMSMSSSDVFFHAMVYLVLIYTKVWRHLWLTESISMFFVLAIIYCFCLWGLLINHFSRNAIFGILFHTIVDQILDYAEVWTHIFGNNRTNSWVFNFNHTKFN